MFVFSLFCAALSLFKVPGGQQIPCPSLGLRAPQGILGALPSALHQSWGLTHRASPRPGASGARSCGLIAGAAECACRASSYGSCANVLGRQEPVFKHWTVKLCVHVHGGGLFQNLALTFLFQIHSILDLCSVIMKIIHEDCRKYDKYKNNTRKPTHDITTER